MDLDERIVIFSLIALGSVPSIVFLLRAFSLKVASIISVLIVAAVFAAFHLLAQHEKK